MTAAEADDVPIRALVPFFLGTFLITWGVVGIYILAPTSAAAWFGQISASHPAFLLATWAPGIVGLLLVAIYGGLIGLKRFVSRILLWRCSLPWAALIFIGLPGLFTLGSVIKGGPLLAAAGEGGLTSLWTTFFLMLFMGPVEEFGWRGVAQPLLQRCIAPLWAGATIGIIWGVWHLPAFFLAGTLQSGWSFAPFFLGNVLLAVIVTPLFNSTRGSLLWPVLFHWQLINPFWADAQPYDTYLLVGVAIIIVWLNRATMFSRVSSPTAVIPCSAAVAK